MSLRSTAERYGSIAVAIHWASAALILAALAGGLAMANIGDAATRAAILPVHIGLGILVLLLTLVRVGWWIWGDRQPSPIANQPPIQEWAARTVHVGLYVAIVVMATSGLATVALSGAVPALLTGAPLPDFNAYPPRAAHGLGARLLLALLVVHVGAALYHQFVRRDRIFARMGMGARK